MLKRAIILYFGTLAQSSSVNQLRPTGPTHPHIPSQLQSKLVAVERKYAPTPARPMNRPYAEALLHDGWTTDATVAALRLREKGVNPEWIYICS